MDYRNGSNGYKSSSCSRNLPPSSSTSTTYLTEQALSMGYGGIPRADSVRRDSSIRLREAIEIEIEKERIRQEIIEAEIIRRKVIEAELERQKIRELSIRRAQFRARQHHDDDDDREDNRLQERLSFSSHPEDGVFDRLRRRNH